MEPLYMLEIFVEKITATMPAEDPNLANKKFVIQIRFGEFFDFVVEREFDAMNEEGNDSTSGDETDGLSDEKIGENKSEQMGSIVSEGNEESNNDSSSEFSKSLQSVPENSKIIIDGRGNKFLEVEKVIKAGKAFTFPSYPEAFINMLNKDPFEVFVWTTDKTEEKLFIGYGKMILDTAYLDVIRATGNPCNKIEPMSSKEAIRLSDENWCKELGMIFIIVRVTPLGLGIETTFQQLHSNPDVFYFKTGDCVTMYTVQKEADFVPQMAKSKDKTSSSQSKSKEFYAPCTEDANCGALTNQKFICEDMKQYKFPKEISPLTKLKLRDIRGPCGNTNCPLAEKVRAFIRRSEAYKRKIANTENITKTKNYTPPFKCGKCLCVENPVWLSPEAEENILITKCEECGGYTKPGTTCRHYREKLGLDAPDCNIYLVAVDAPGPFQKQSVQRISINNSLCSYHRRAELEIIDEILNPTNGVLNYNLHLASSHIALNIGNDTVSMMSLCRQSQSCRSFNKQLTTECKSSGLSENNRSLDHDRSDKTWWKFFPHKVFSQINNSLENDGEGADSDDREPMVFPQIKLRCHQRPVRVRMSDSSSTRLHKAPKSMDVSNEVQSVRKYLQNLFMQIPKKKET